MHDQTRFGLRDGMELAGVDLAELWWRYAAIGGSGDPASLALRVLGTSPCDPHEHDLIAQALNEVFIDRDEGTYPVGYAGPQSASAPKPAGRAVPSVDVDSVPASRSLEPRRRAALARLRSAAAARNAAALHATAAQLMQTSGQLQFARHADARAQAARQRSVAATAA